MTSTSRSVGRRLGLTVAVSPVSLLVPPAALSTLTWLTATNPVSLPAFLSSYAILQIAWGSYVPWSRRPRGLPIFSIIAFIYWIFFAAALFWGERRIFARHFVPIGDDYVTEAVQMALVGVICLWAGMRLPVKTTAVENLPDIDYRAVAVGRICELFGWLQHWLACTHQRSIGSAPVAAM
jgi:hypothetical protein